MEHVMLTHFFKSPSHIQLLLSRPGGPLLEGFSDYLEQLGYAKNSGYMRITTASHILCWADQEGIPLPLGEVALSAFSAHLARCQCQGFAHLRCVVAVCGARLFVKHLGGVGARPSSFAALESKLRSGLFSAFCHWMRQERGTSDATLHANGNALRDLFEQIGDDPSQLDARYLRQFILAQSAKKSRPAAKLCTTALRNLVRFLIAEGKCPPTLIDAIPKLAYWRLSTLPRYLHMDEVEQVIASCDAATSCGRRDRAIVLLLARLGLRAGDVQHLRLGDIDWKGASIAIAGKKPFRGETYNTLLSLLACTGLRISEAINLRYTDITPDGLVIRCTKFAKSRLVPLHASAIAGLERYLERRRPYAPCDDHVFISTAGTPLLSQNINIIFHDAAVKIGLPMGPGLPRPTPHSLRHTFAVRALESCSDDRDHITKHMVALSTYLGHAKIANTYWYFQATPTLMAGIAECSERFVMGEPS